MTGTDARSKWVGLAVATALCLPSPGPLEAQVDRRVAAPLRPEAIETTQLESRATGRISRGTSMLPTPRKVSAQALKVQAEGRWPEAQKLLQDALRGCGDQDRECRLLLTYTLGYAYQLESERDRDRREAYLRRARQSFLAVLEEAPDHAATLRLLAGVHREMGDLDEAADALERASDSDPATVARSALLLAEVEEAQLTAMAERSGGMTIIPGEIGARGRERLQARYLQAAELDSRAVTPRQRLVDLYLGGPLGQIPELLELVSDWEDQHPQLAARAYTGIMNAAHPADNKLAGEALIAWTSLLARTEQISEKRLADLPDSWDAPAPKELRSYVRTLWWNPEGGDAGWWQQSSRRRQVAIQVAIALGKSFMDRGQVERTRTCWTRAVAGSWSFDDDGLPVDLYSELALLYTNYPDLDPDGSGFSRLEDRMFQGKGEAYLGKDLKAIQKYHSLLGLIYSERQTLSSNRRFRNAVYQLSQATRIARRRAAEGEPYEPQSVIKTRLAEAYDQLNDRRAAASYLGAAQALLDGDDLAGAARMSNRAAELAGTRLAPAIAAFEDLVHLRSGVTAHEPRSDFEAAWEKREIDLWDAHGRYGSGRVILASAVTPKADRLCDSADDRLRELGAAGLDSDFLARQRFKVLADCSTVESSALALRSAVDDGISLVGAADYLRLERIQSMLQAVAPADSGPEAAGQLPLSVGGIAEGRYIEVDAAALRTSRLSTAELAQASGELRTDVPVMVIDARE